MKWLCSKLQRRKRNQSLSERQNWIGGICVCFLLLLAASVTLSLYTLCVLWHQSDNVTDIPPFRPRVARDRNHSTIPVSEKKNNNTSPLESPLRLLYNDNHVDNNSEAKVLLELPSWIREYTIWHSQMRQQFPGMQLFTHPNAPPVLIRACLGLCGGLHDRVGQLPWDLYLANATQRVLLLAWQRPRALENFLVPNHPHLLDWTIPEEFHCGFDDMHRVRNFTELFQGYPEDHPTDQFWNHDIDAALERAKTEFKHHKVLRHRILGHLGEHHLQQRLQRLGESDDVHSNPHFGRIFWLFFRPSPPIEASIHQIFQVLQLRPFLYSAVHCRVRHPKATSYGNHFVGKNPKYPADKTGLPWYGDTRQFALTVATDALNCSRIVASTEPVYFLSDSNDLVRHVTMELVDPQFVQENRSMIDMSLYSIVQNDPPIKARDVTEETVHLDRQKGRLAPAYYDTFVDLMLVIHARCVIYGIGYYAAFGAKISGTQCQYIYQKEAWGNQAAKSARVCPNTETN